MKRRIGWMALSLMFIASVLAGDAAGKQHVVYIANSYNPATFEWTGELLAGIFRGFEAKGLKKDVDYTVIADTMDALVKSSEEEMKKEAARILQDINERRPDIVITTDDDALRLIGLEIDGIPVVFNGVNGAPVGYLQSPRIDSMEKPGHNITGVYQTTYYQQSLDLIKSIFPAAKTFAVATDNLTTSVALMADVKKQADSLPLALKDELMSDRFSEWKAKITEWQNTVDCLFVFSNNGVKDENGVVMPPADVVKWIADNSRLPDTSPWAYQVKDGILLSASDSGEEQGAHAAEMAVAILNGADPGAIPIMTPPKGVPVINQGRAMKLDAHMPPDVLEKFIEFGQIF